MSRTVFISLCLIIGAAFALSFAVIVLPPLFESGDIVGAFAAGFVNPYSSGYSLDAIFCGLVLLVWVIYERQHRKVRHGWVVIPMIVLPGVATAFALYLVLRLQNKETV